MLMSAVYCPVFTAETAKPAAASNLWFSAHKSRVFIIFMSRSFHNLPGESVINLSGEESC